MDFKKPITVIILSQIVIILFVLMGILCIHSETKQIELRSAKLNESTQMYLLAKAENEKQASEFRKEAEQKRYDYYNRIFEGSPYWKELKK